VPSINRKVSMTKLIAHFFARPLGIPISKGGISQPGRRPSGSHVVSGQHGSSLLTGTTGARAQLGLPVFTQGSDTMKCDPTTDAGSRRLVRWSRKQ
jgi:hypothetical protein